MLQCLKKDSSYGPYSKLKLRKQSQSSYKLAAGTISRFRNDRVSALSRDNSPDAARISVGTGAMTENHNSSVYLAHGPMAEESLLGCQPPCDSPGQMSGSVTPVMHLQEAYRPD